MWFDPQLKHIFNTQATGIGCAHPHAERARLGRCAAEAAAGSIETQPCGQGRAIRQAGSVAQRIAVGIGKAPLRYRIAEQITGFPFGILQGQHQLRRLVDRGSRLDLQLKYIRDTQAAGIGRAHPHAERTRLGRCAAEAAAGSIETQPCGQGRAIRQAGSVAQRIAVFVAKGVRIEDEMQGRTLHNRLIRKRCRHHRRMIDRIGRFFSAAVVGQTNTQIAVFPVQNLRVPLPALHVHEQGAATDAERIAAIRGGPGMRGYLFKPLPVDTLVVQPQGAFAVFVVYRGDRSGFLKTQTPQIVAVVAAAVLHEVATPAAVVRIVVAFTIQTVVTRTAPEHIVARAAVQQPLVRPGVQLVIAGLAAQLVPARAAKKRIVSLAAKKQIGCAIVFTGKQLVIAAATVQTIRTLAGHQHIVAFLPPGQRYRIVTPERVVSSPAPEHVAACLTSGPVIARACIDPVRTGIRLHSRRHAQAHPRRKGKIITLRDTPAPAVEYRPLGKHHDAIAQVADLPHLACGCVPVVFPRYRNTVDRTRQVHGLQPHLIVPVAKQHIVARSAAKLVTASAAKEKILAAAADKRIVSFFARHPVAEPSTRRLDIVCGKTAVQHIRSAAAVDDIAAAAPLDMIVVALRRTRLQRVACPDELVARSAQDEVVAAVGQHQVGGSVTGLDPVAVLAAGEVVVARTADNPPAPRRPLQAHRQIKLLPLAVIRIDVIRILLMRLPQANAEGAIGKIRRTRLVGKGDAGIPVDGQHAGRVKSQAHPGTAVRIPLNAFKFAAAACRRLKRPGNQPFMPVTIPVENVIPAAVDDRIVTALDHDIDVFSRSADKGVVTGAAVQSVLNVAAYQHVIAATTIQGDTVRVAQTRIPEQDVVLPCTGKWSP